MVFVELVELDAMSAGGLGEVAGTPEDAFDTSTGSGAVIVWFLELVVFSFLNS